MKTGLSIHFLQYMVASWKKAIQSKIGSNRPGSELNEEWTIGNEDVVVMITLLYR